MLRFYSANVRIANHQRAIDECIDIAFENNIPRDCKIVIMNSALGHSLDRLAQALATRIPDAIMLGSSCSGVTGRDGVGESMNDIAMMAIAGPGSEADYAAVDGIYGRNSYEKGLELAAALKAKCPNATAIYLLCPGIDIANSLVLRAFDETFGPDIVIFGGTASDNMRGLICQQYLGDAMTEHGAWAIGFSDPTLSAVTRATHGFTAYGEPLVVTKAEGNRIYTLGGKPAWQEYVARLGLTPEQDAISETIPIGALAEELPADLAAEYGNPHILRAVTGYDADGTMHFPVEAREGMKLWLTVRDEELIFSEQQRALGFLTQTIGSKSPVAVFQTDCLARGRFLFNKIIKDEIIAMMHSQLSSGGVVPPWLGMYGFGEYARLGDRNTFHNYSTSLMVLYR